MIFIVVEHFISTQNISRMGKDEERSADDDLQLRRTAPEWYDTREFVYFYGFYGFSSDFSIFYVR